MLCVIACYYLVCTHICAIFTHSKNWMKPHAVQKDPTLKSLLYSLSVHLTAAQNMNCLRRQLRHGRSHLCFALAIFGASKCSLVTSGLSFEKAIIGRSWTHRLAICNILPETFDWKKRGAKYDRPRVGRSLLLLIWSFQSPGGQPRRRLCDPVDRGHVVECFGMIWAICFSTCWAL